MYLSVWFKYFDSYSFIIKWDDKNDAARLWTINFSSNCQGCWAGSADTLIIHFHCSTWADALHMLRTLDPGWVNAACVYSNLLWSCNVERPFTATRVCTGYVITLLHQPHCVVIVVRAYKGPSAYEDHTKFSVHSPPFKRWSQLPHPHLPSPAPCRLCLDRFDSSRSLNLHT